MNKFYSTLLLFFIIFNASAQDSTKVRKLKVLPVPAFGFAPETRYYVGAVCLFTINPFQDTLTRTSTAKVEFNYTWNRQIILEGELDYFFKEEKWFLGSNIHYSKYPDQYFGIGARTLDSDGVLFQSNRLKLDVELSKQVLPKTFLGGGIRYFNYSNIGTLSDTVALHDELTNFSDIEIKVDFFKDDRDRILTPTTGSFCKLTVGVNYANTVYLHLLADARKYYSFGKKKNNVVAARFLQTSIIGDAPFYDLAILGGDRIARGYFYGRFRDQHLSTLQAEYRSPYLWRFGLAAFGGTSLVYGTGDFGSESVKPNVGVGLRFLVDKNDRTNLRFDYAIGRDGQSGFYVSFGESF
ncbi:MAG: BamA/TamA family outer membrane protein [Crocinitomicaceae bacterium]|nr:outer membrane protein assembly factor [Flavobacteriales bacterium]NQZ36751.1 BamA/TamA family outer membrane protein [Crocinitomicaceae bacterium]